MLNLTLTRHIFQIVLTPEQYIRLEQGDMFAIYNPNGLCPLATMFGGNHFVSPEHVDGSTSIGQVLGFSMMEMPNSFAVSFTYQTGELLSIHTLSSQHGPFTFPLLMICP